MSSHKQTIKNIIKFLGFCTFIPLVFSTLPGDAASLELSPGSNSFVNGCTSRVDIIVDSTNQNSNAADIEITYNPKEIDIIDSKPDISGIQIKDGNAYESYIENRVVPAQSRIFMAGVSINTILTSRKIFATIFFTNKPNVTSTNFTIKFDGVGESFTLDSNVADTITSKDILTSIRNGAYTFIPGYCEKEPPKIVFQNPVDRQKNVLTNSQVSIKITDNSSGVDLNSVEFNINDYVYKANSPEVSYLGNPLEYNFLIRPKNRFYSDKESFINVVALDKAKNTGQGQIIFDPPIICSPDTSVVIQKPADTNNNINITENREPNIENVEKISKEYLSKNNFSLTELAKINLVPTSTSTDKIFKGAPFIANTFTDLTTGNVSQTPLPILLYYTLLTILSSFFVILGFLLMNKNRRVAGFAIDSISGLAISYAPIEVYELTTNKFITVHETGKNGKYVFHLPTGEYQLKIDFRNTEWSEFIAVSETNKTKKLNTTFEQQTTKLDLVIKCLLLIRLGFIKLAPGMMFSGFILSLVNLYIFPSTLNIFITVLYIVIFVLFVILPVIYKKYVRPMFQKLDHDMDK